MKDRMMEAIDLEVVLNVEKKVILQEIVIMQ
jgi:hypothetical protein